MVLLKCFERYDFLFFQNPLHSIMVLLKSYSRLFITTFSIVFTFHYGIIKIHALIRFMDDFKNFTFHYGIIKIHMLQNL